MTLNKVTNVASVAALLFYAGCAAYGYWIAYELKKG